MVSEMIKILRLEKIHTIPRCFQYRFTGQMDAPSSWKIVKLVFLWKPDAERKKGIRSYRAIALTSVMSWWYTPFVMMCMEKEKVPETWHRLRIGGINKITC